MSGAGILALFFFAIAVLCPLAAAPAIMRNPFKRYPDSPWPLRKK